MVVLNLFLPLIAALAAFIPLRILSQAIISIVGLLLIANNIYLLQSPDILSLGTILGYKVQLETEPFAIIFAIMVSILYACTNFYSFFFLSAQETSNLEQDLRPKIHFFFTPIAIASCLGAAYSTNLISLFIFYELLTLSTYPLVIQSFSDTARKAGKLYITMLFSSSSFFLLFAIIFIDNHYGTLSFSYGGSLPVEEDIKNIVLLLICFVFGFSKTAIFPLYAWLPKAMVAPIPVSALLHAVAVVKTGIFALTKVFIYLFGIDYLSQIAKISPWSIDWLTYLCCFTILFAGFSAVASSTLKKILAFSTISQLSYMVLALSFVSKASVIAAFMQMLSHSIAKSTLFFTAGIIYLSLHKTKIESFQDMFKAIPVPVLLFILASFSIMGFPFTIGHISVGGLYSSIPKDKIIVIICLAMSSLLYCFYFIKIIYKMLQPDELSEAICYHNISALTWITAATFSLSLLLMFYYQEITSYLLSRL
jgi:multicomponent Na+:H+ antiporter subunit D